MSDISRVVKKEEQRQQQQAQVQQAAQRKQRKGGGGGGSGKERVRTVVRFETNTLDLRGMRAIEVSSQAYP